MPKSWKYFGSGSGSVSVLKAALGFFFIFEISSFAQADGPTKDITFARPKHLRYPSYKSLQHNNDTPDEQNRLNRTKQSRPKETLESEESRQSHQTLVEGKEGRKYSNSTTEASATNLKRSLLPGADVFGDAKAARFGSPLGIQKTPPDLQFGLAFTVPFVSLSTDKLINTFSGKSYGGNDVSNILKLNLGGLIAAVIVGIGAFFLVPGLLHPGKFGGGVGGGWGGGLLDNLLPNGIPGILDHFLGGGGGGHSNYNNDGGDGWGGNEDHIGNRPFGYQDFYEYNGVHNHNRKDTSATLREKSSRREGRSNSKNGTVVSSPTTELLGNLMSSVSSYAKKYVTTAQNCLQLQICRKALPSNSSTKEKKERKKEDEEIDFLGLVESLSDNELVRGSPLSQEIKKAHEHGQAHGECQKYEKPECK